MKIITNTFILLAAFIFTQCSTEENISASDAVESIELSSDKADVQAQQKITFTARTNTGEDVTAASTFLVNNQAIEGNEYTPIAEGNISIKAVYENIESNTLTITVNALEGPITSIVLQSDKSTVTLGGEVVFSVVANTGQDVTDMSTISVGGTPITGHTHKAAALGTFTATAAYQSLSAEKIITVTEGGKFRKNVLIEKYTGTWCGSCTEPAYAIEQLEANADYASRIVPIGIHVGSGSNSDIMENEYSIALSETYVPLEQRNIFGIVLKPTRLYPFVHIDRGFEWQRAQYIVEDYSAVTNLLKEDEAVGIALASSLSGTDIALDVKVKFGKAFTEQLKLVVFIVEDGIIETQRNYSTHYGGSGWVKDFEHNHVLRHALTNISGDNIPVAEAKAGSVYTKAYKATVPDNVANAAKMSFVAIVIGESGEAINARKVKINAANDFEEK